MPRSTSPFNANSASDAEGGTPDKEEPITIDQAATADYIVEMSGQLARMAGDARLSFVAYLLDMVRVEADTIRQRAKPMTRPAPT